MKKKFTLLALVLFFVSNAQSTLNELVQDWQRSKLHSIAIINSMPENKLSFKASEETRTFAEEFFHIVGANYGMSSTVFEVENIGKGFSKDLTKKNLLKQVEDSYNFVIKNLGSFDVDKFNDQVKMFGKYDITKGRALVKIYEHQAHHKSKAIVIQRASGETSPNYMLF